MALTGASLERARRRWFARTLEVLLGVAIPVYLVALFVNRELGVAKALELPLIFASLIIAIELLQRQDAAVAALDKRVAAMETNLAGLIAAAMAQREGAEVKFYRNRQLYDATRQAIAEAKSRVYVSYLRNYGPSRADGSHPHVEACRAWALRHPDHRFRRVIREGPDAGLSYSSDVDAVIGLSIKSREIVQQYFEPYFDKLWKSAKPIDERSASA